MDRILTDWRFRIPSLALLSLAAGAGITAWLKTGAFIPIGDPVRAWLGASALLWLCLIVLAEAWRWGGGGRLLGWMIGMAFLLRLGCALVLFWGLPQMGRTEPTYQAGYVFYDAFARDNMAWDLSSRPVAQLGAALQQEFVQDQYGGLLALSALVYRLFSLDAHRPYLVTILAAAIGALGVVFLWKAVRLRWGEPAAGWASWIFALYPESILLGSAQMREPFLITLVAILFWGVCAWPEIEPSVGKKDLRSLRIPWGLTATMALSLLALLAFSSRVAVPVILILGLYLFVDRLIPWLSQKSSGGPERGKVRFPRLPLLGKVNLQGLAWGAVALVGVAALGLTWGWLQSSSTWDTSLTVTTSGQVQRILEGVPDVLRMPIIIAYGLAQPVLPAAVADPAPFLWQTLAILRAAGWYALAPLLIYTVAILAIGNPWKKGLDKRQRNSLIFFAVVTLAWLVISSARAGGDQWDNPRYRTIFLPWLALLAGWGWQWARSQCDPWLVRWIAVEVICLGFFTQWYAARYLHLGSKLPFWLMIALILAFGGLVLLGGWAWDRFKRRRVLTP